MSLAITYHEKEFGIVCSDGRVSERMPSGRYAVRKETARKFEVLRARPGLVLAGTSSISSWLDFAVYDAVRRYAEDFPEATFDQVARIIGPAVYEARAAFRVVRCLSAPSAIPKFFRSTDGSSLNLLGYDRERMRVRNRVFSCTAHYDEWERENGVTIIGDVDADEGWEFAGKFLELVGRDHRPKVIVESMLSIAAEISASHPETIGAPYFFHLVTKGMMPASRDIEEQFRRAV